jgi:hypothetical protein
MTKIAGSDPLVRAMDPRIRIRIHPKMSWIRSTDNRIFSVADPGCSSRIPDFYPSRIPDPKTGTKERGEKFFFVKHFFVDTNFTKCKIILFLNCSRKKIWDKFQRIMEIFTQKVVTKLSKI